jgi:putative ABC transport system permease protein
VADHGFDAIVYANHPAPKVATLPGVASATELISPFNGQPTCTCTHRINPDDISVVVASPKAKAPFNLVSGHLPDPSEPDQVLASFTLEQDGGVHVGTVIHVPLYAASQFAAVNSAIGAGPPPRGPTVALHVVGIEATEIEFPSGESPTYLLYATQAFARTVLPRTAVTYYYFVRLRHGVSDIPRFSAAVSKLSLGTGGYSSEDAFASSVEVAIHPQAIGWWVLAALATLVGIAVVGQAMARQSFVESEDYPTMGALGVDRRQLVALGMARNLVVALAGAAGAVALATALSPLAPLGEARAAETSTGVTFDTLVLPLGALCVVAVVLALGIVPAMRAAGAVRSSDQAIASRPSAVVARLAATGASPSAVIGVRNALERRSGGGTVPVGSALLGTVLAVVALCGTAVFGASLSHLTATPRLYGDPFQLSFNPNGGQSDPPLLGNLERNRAITGITKGGGGGELSINHVVTWTLAASPVRGRLLFSAVDGHLPNGPDQVALGATTMRQVGAHVGSVVDLTISKGGRKRTMPYRVVSQVSLPVLAAGSVGLGNGALITIPGLEHLFCPPGPEQTACRQKAGNQSNGGVLASVVPGARGRAAVNHYLEADSSIATVPIIPTSLINFGEAVNFPLIFGAMLAVFGAATLAHLLVVSVSRRRREIGLLKVLGFVNHQVASAVAWQATTLALVGAVIGVPLGLVIGQDVWREFANNLGAVPISVVPIWLIGALVVGVVLVANLIAVAPALVATRSKPGYLLRTS